MKLSIVGRIRFVTGLKKILKPVQPHRFTRWHTTLENIYSVKICKHFNTNIYLKQDTSKIGSSKLATLGLCDIGSSTLFVFCNS